MMLVGTAPASIGLKTGQATFIRKVVSKVKNAVKIFPNKLENWNGCSWSSVSKPIHTPSWYIQSHIRGKVQGLPTIVPIAEAIMFALNTQAKRPAITKWSPTKGVNEIDAPNAIPAEIAYVESGMRLIRWSQYLSVRISPILGHIKFLNMVIRSGLMRRLNIKVTMILE